jgi:phosphopantetheinyl transferase
LLQEKKMQEAIFKIQPNMLEYGEFEVWKVRGKPDCNLLSREERLRFDAISGQGVRETFLLGKCAIRNIVEYYTTENARDVSIHTHPGGKPYLINYPDLHFSLSHSGSDLAICFSRTPVGFDMEKKERRADFFSLARRFFSPTEVEEMVSAGSNAGRLFLDFWTAKEAILKLEGTGISGGLERAVVLSTSAGALDDRPVHLRGLEWPGLIAKLASFEKPAEVRVKELVFD